MAYASIASDSASVGNSTACRRARTSRCAISTPERRRRSIHKGRRASRSATGAARCRRRSAPRATARLPSIASMLRIDIGWLSTSAEPTADVMPIVARCRAAAGRALVDAREHVDDADRAQPLHDQEDAPQEHEDVERDVARDLAERRDAVRAREITSARARRRTTRTRSARRAPPRSDTRRTPRAARSRPGARRDGDARS